MNKKYPFVILIVLLLFVTSCAEPLHIRVVPRHPEELVKLTILEPQPGTLLPSDTVRIGFTTTNFNLGVAGNAIHFVLDNGPRIVHKTTEPFVLSSLSEGRHVIRAFPVKGWGESIKDPEAFAVTQFYVKNKNTELLNLNLPMLTYNEPAGFYKKETAQRILLDFLVHNAILSEYGYAVRYTLDGVQKVLTDVAPLYLTSLKPGTHTITLELIDKQGSLAEGNFVKTQREITILD